MAVIQISRIQHRRGFADDLPNALAEGELGFATDTGELFIGASSTDLVANRTAFPYKNIKILTEFDVQRSVTGDVYYHGALLRQVIDTSGATLIPLFKVENASFGVYDFSISVVTDDSLPDADSSDAPGTPLQIGTIHVCGDKLAPVMSLTALGQSGAEFTNAGLTILASDTSQVGKIAFTVVAEAVGGTTQISLKIMNDMVKYRFNLAGREWLAVGQV
jgi:hypothetical protein